ncbi:MAG: hypothetical protein JO328_01245 [Hyphomicrobiales bacterium]|nr:hypothetical protein [Hyphomicrobiales bacterium]MBV8825581.1 hypothetical protein [Hyphomicrobiales bacterium]MBV9430098.1 hypothetical protein [Bradyrhizobiaceae bacterium]
MAATAESALSSRQTPAARPFGLHRLSGGWLCAAPALIATVLFAYLYSTATPLTDEWIFLHAAIDLHSLDWHSWADWKRALEIYPFKPGDHVLALPFAIYLIGSELSNYDQRVEIAITIATLIAQIAAYRSVVSKSAWMTFVLSVIIFNPARYMDFLWGFEFHEALSIMFAILGVAALRRLGSSDYGFWRTIVIGLALMAAAILSSAAGYFGLLGAAAMVSVMRIEARCKFAALAIIAAAFIALYVLLRPPSHALIADWHREAFYVLTALGGVLWSSPVGLFSFPINVRSVTGAVLILLFIITLWRAWNLHRVSEIAFPLGLVVFGLFGAAAIGVNREYLGNWHLQFVAPAVCGIFMCAWVVSKRTQLRIDLLAAVVILVGAVMGAREAFLIHGPAYNAYVRSIERYILNFTPNSPQPKPYPARPPQWDVDQTMVGFLKTRHHVLFAGSGG